MNTQKQQEKNSLEEVIFAVALEQHKPVTTVWVEMQDAMNHFSEEELVAHYNQHRVYGTIEK